MKCNTYSAIVCFALLALGIYCISYMGREWPIQDFYPGEYPFRIEAGKSLTVNYTITYNGIGDKEYADNGTFAHLDFLQPAETFERSELDQAHYYTDVIAENATYEVRVYSPSNMILNEGLHSDGDSGVGLGWPIEKSGTYRIVITNLSPTEPLKMKGTFQFTRISYFRPFLNIGYIVLFLGLGFPLTYILGRLQKVHSHDRSQH